MNILLAISISYCESFQYIIPLKRPVIRQNSPLTVLSGESSTPNKRMGSRKNIPQETEKIIQYSNQVSNRFTSKYTKYENQKAAAEGFEMAPPRKSSARKPSLAESEQVTEKIMKLLNDNLEQPLLFKDDDIADNKTVFAKLSDEDLREAADVAKTHNKKQPVDLEENMRNLSKKSKARVKASVMETGRDTINQYVKSFQEHQVLSREHEQVLGRQIQILAKWEEKRQELQFQLERAPTFAEWAECVGTTESELKTQVRGSKKAKSALVQSNLRLVITIARQTMKSGRGIDFKIACQEGIIGLNRAAEKFDPSKGFRFSSYACWWIRKYVQQNCVEQVRGPIKIPWSVMKEINSMRVFEKVLRDELGRWPNDHEVAEKCGITVKRLGFIRQTIDQKKFGSLDATLTNGKKGGKDAESNTQFHEIVEDNSNLPSDLINQQMLKEDVRRLIRTLSPKEQAVIRLRFGLDKGSPATIKEIGKKFKVDDSIIIKIELKALKKLRDPYRNKSLEAYMPDL